jgi:hypothetical protein
VFALLACLGQAVSHKKSNGKHATVTFTKTGGTVLQPNTAITGKITFQQVRRFATKQSHPTPPIPSPRPAQADKDGPLTISVDLKNVPRTAAGVTPAGQPWHVHALPAAPGALGFTGSNPNALTATAGHWDPLGACVREGVSERASACVRACVRACLSE